MALMKLLVLANRRRIPQARGASIPNTIAGLRLGHTKFVHNYSQLCLLSIYKFTPCVFSHLRITGLKACNRGRIRLRRVPDTRYCNGPRLSIQGVLSVLSHLGADRWYLPGTKHRHTYQSDKLIFSSMHGILKSKVLAPIAQSLAPSGPDPLGRRQK